MKRTQSIERFEVHSNYFFSNNKIILLSANLITLFLFFLLIYCTHTHPNFLRNLTELKVFIVQVSNKYINFQLTSACGD